MEAIRAALEGHTIALKPTSTTITRLDGTRYEEKDGNVKPLPAEATDEDNSWAVMDETSATLGAAEEETEPLPPASRPALRALAEQHPELVPYVKLLQLGAPKAAVAGRITVELGSEALAAKMWAAADQSGIEVDDDEDVGGVLRGSEAEMHGQLGVGKGWRAPRLVTNCGQAARPGYASRKAHEYIDEPEVLQAKVQVLAELFRRAATPVIYAGAGLSTSAGISDYATRGSGIVKRDSSHDTKLLSPLCARPSRGHAALTQLYENGLLYRFIQQNHDGLPQKAGLPQSCTNEIHGGWFDPSNPVVAMNGQLREDLFGDLLELERSADLAVALGSSLCGMNADRIISTCAARARRGKTLGSVIVSLQQTVHDENSSLRIFGLLDDVLDALLEALKIDPNSQTTPPTPIPSEFNPEPDVFYVPYSPSGERLGADEPRRLLDLREGAKLVISSGSSAGDQAEVIGKNAEGHYRLRVKHTCRAGDPKVKAMWSEIRLLGRWWPAELARGDVLYCPVTTL